MEPFMQWMLMGYLGKNSSIPIFSPIRVSFVCWKGVCERWFHAPFIFTSCVISCSGNLGLCLKPRICRVKIWSISICLFAFAAVLVSIYSVKILQHYKISCAGYTFWGSFFLIDRVSLVRAVLCEYSDNQARFAKP